MNRLHLALLISSCLISLNANAAPVTYEATVMPNSSLDKTTMLTNTKMVEKMAGKMVESSPLATPLGLSEAAEQYHILYTSISGIDGKSLREDSGAVFLPKGPMPQNGWPVVVWTHGTIGVASKCAPSLNPRSARDTQYLNTWLSMGFAIVAPDYPGLGSAGLHHYLDARAEAWSVLDSVKAAREKFPLANQLILVGQSQGAHAAFAAAGYQAEYAPELNIVASVLTGTPYFKPEISAERLFSIDNQVTGGDPKLPYVMYSYLSAADQDNSLQPNDYFQDQAIDTLAQANKLCIGELTELVMKKQMNAGNSLKPGIERVLAKQLPHFSYNTIKINHPVFIGIGLADINVPTLMQQLFAKDVIAAGTPATVVEYPQMSHGETVNVSLRDSIPFVLQTINNQNKRTESTK